MFTFQSIMFVSLGFLCALLLGFVVAPAFWARAVRLTTERMRASLPLTEREISAERDRLRAENAIRVHQLTAKIERGRLYDARQKVEINRRDGTISALQRRLQAIETEREGSENARRVLEATITQRVPEVESRLMEARQLLVKRDAEMKALQSDTSRTFRALDDAMQVNAQQRAEIDRLKMSLAGHGVRTQGPASGPESETALLAELETLRARSRDQAALISRLQSAAKVGGGYAEAGGHSDGGAAGRGRRGEADLIALKPVVANDDQGWEAPDRDAEAAAAMRQAETDALTAKISDQADKIEALNAQIAAYEQTPASGGRSLSLRDTKAALKSRVAGSERNIAAKDKTIVELRRELANANERIARQASYYQDELRRLGSRVGAEAGGSGGKDQVADGGVTGASAAPALGVPGRQPPSLPDVSTDAAPGEMKEAQEQRVVASADRETSDDKMSLEARLASAAKSEASESTYDFDQHFAPEEVQPEPVKPETRAKLMDRIAGIAKR